MLGACAKGTNVDNEQLVQSTGAVREARTSVMDSTKVGEVSVISIFITIAGLESIP